MGLITSDEFSRTLAIAGTKPNVDIQQTLEKDFPNALMEGVYSIEKTLSGIQLHVMDAKETQSAQWNLNLPLA